MTTNRQVLSLLIFDRTDNTDLETNHCLQGHWLCLPLWSCLGLRSWNENPVQYPVEDFKGYEKEKGYHNRRQIIRRIRQKEKTVSTYSTVSFVRCNGGLFSADVTFNFSITYRSPALFGNHYSAYQLFLYETIIEHREKRKTFDQIAEWLNKKGYLTVRGKEFRREHVHSILKKRLAKEGLLNREFLMPISACIMQ